MTDKYGPNTFSEAMSIIRGLEARVAELEATPEYVNTQNEIEIASLRAEVERLKRGTFITRHPNAPELNAPEVNDLIAEVERLKASEEAAWKNSVSLRAEIERLKVTNAAERESTVRAMLSAVGFPHGGIEWLTPRSKTPTGDHSTE